MNRKKTMRKFRYILLTALMMVLFTDQASAQLRLGVKGGVNSMPEYTGFHGGVALQVGIPLIGLKVQPELIYTTKGSTLSFQDKEVTDFRSGYLEIPVHVQMGLDLILLRPYLCVSPYAAFALHDSFKRSSDHSAMTYGIGVGGGLDIWRLQVQVLYQWDLSPYWGERNYRGLQTSVAFFF